MLLTSIYHLIVFLQLFRYRSVSGESLNLKNFDKDEIVFKVWQNGFYSTGYYSDDSYIYLTISSSYGLNLQVLDTAIFSKMHGGEKIPHNIVECSGTGLIGDIGIKLEMISERKVDKIEVHVILLLCEPYCTKICEKSLPHTWSRDNVRHLVSEPMKTYHVAKLKRNARIEGDEHQSHTLETPTKSGNTTDTNITNYIHVHWSMVLMCSIIFLGLFILVVSLFVFMWNVKRASRLREDFMPLIQNESKSPITVSDESDNN